MRILPPNRCAKRTSHISLRAKRHRKSRRSTDAEAQTRQQRLGSLGHRPRLHGPELRLWPSRREAGRYRADPRRRRTRLTFFDTAEVYGPSPTRSWWAKRLAPFRDQVVIATKFGFKLDPRTGKQLGLDSRPEHIKRGRRGLAQAAQDRPHRPLLSAPRRSGGADRGRRRRGEGPDPGRQGQALRPVRGRRADDPPRPCGAAGRRAAERIFAVVARARGRRSCRRSRSSASASSPSARWARASSPARSTRTRPSTAATSATSCRASRPRRARPTRLWSICSARSRPQAGDAGPDRARLAAGPEALDRADPRHHQAAPPGREHRRGRRRADARTISRDIDSAASEDHGARRPLSGTSAEAGRPLRAPHERL